MKVTNVDFKKESFGIAKTSLKVLRNAIAENCGGEIAVVQVPTNDICCGYFIYVPIYDKVIFAGDGFRLDGGGEGGAGQNTAECLFKIFGIEPIEIENKDLSGIYSDDDTAIKAFLLKIAKEIAEYLDSRDFSVPLKQTPQYIRNR